MRRHCCQPPRLALPEPAPESAGVLPPGLQAPATPTTRRILALHLPRFGAEGFGQGPLVIWRQDGSRRVVCALDAEAERLGLRIGQALADAQAIAPGIRAEAETPDRHAERLSALALWALRFTPLAAASPPDGLLLDITGCAHLHGGEQALLDRLVTGLQRLGHAAMGATAGTPEAAAALARAGFGAPLAPGSETEALAPLSPALLGLDPGILSSLSKVGLRSIGALLALPRAPLARRFGPRLLGLLDAATGRTATPIRPIRPPAAFTVVREPAEPVVSREAIDAFVGVMLPELCRALEGAGHGVRRMILRAFRVDGGVQEVVIGTAGATRDAAHLLRLLSHRIERLAPGFGFDRLELLAAHAEPLPVSQPCITDRSVDLAPLLDRLSQRARLWRAQPRAGHWPERAIKAVPATARFTAPPGWPPRPRPTRLLRRPDRVETTALLPDAPPRRLFWRGRWRVVAAAEGPERIEHEWWRDGPAAQARDYYRIGCEDGLRLWVCAVGSGGDRRWFVHGIDA